MGNLTAKTSGDIASFMSPSITNIKSLKVHFSPKQLGTGDPSPENVREIVGWDGVEVNSCGKNLINLNTIKQGYRVNIQGGVVLAATYCLTDYIPVFPSSKYYLSNAGTLAANACTAFYDKNKELLSTTSKITPITTPSNCAYIKCSFRIENIDIVQLELGSTATSYKPYQGNNILIDWSSEIGTVYGGYVDLISGELVEEWGMFTVNESDSTWRVAAYNRITINFPRKYIFGSRLLKDKSMCTILPENHTNWNYGYIDNVASITNPHALSLNYTGNGEGWSELFGEEATNENVKSHLQELGFAICATLATPITHQLTPTQLKSFVGQNNFWSNADYVEVEYDLIETIDIQKAKQKIILNQPQLKTISDKIVSFNTDMVAPMKNCKIYFKPIQLRTGDPSPTNVRNINGWTELDSYVNGNKVSVDWTNDIGTIYGGYVDLVKGELVAEYESISDTWGNWGTLYDQGDGTELRYKKFTNNIIGGSAGYNNSYCNIAKYSYNNNNGTIHFYIVSTSKNCRIYLPSGTDTSLQIQAVAKLAEPIHYQLTSQQLLTFKSTNHIWSETNGQQIDVKYWTHKNLTPVPLTNYIENQTWTDSAYIGSSGKKTTNTVSASHFLTNQILLEAGTYVLSGFSYYVGTDNTNFRIHAYDSSGNWLRQITFQQIGNLSPVDISFTLDTDTYVNVSIAMDFDGVLVKIN